MARPVSDPKKRFIEKVIIMENSCHNWSSTLHRDGYGKFYFKGKQMQAHRAAYELFVGEIVDGLHVLHNCDNRKCVNPAHLYAGTPKQNVADKHDRCSWYGNMKFKREIVDKCFELRSLGHTQQYIANALGMNQGTVGKYLSKKLRKLH